VVEVLSTENIFEAVDRAYMYSGQPPDCNDTYWMFHEFTQALKARVPDYIPPSSEDGGISMNHFIKWVRSH